jgi:single-strand DNA-binding protein
MYQQLIIVGNLGRDPEMRYTPSGTPVTSMNIATNRKYTGSDGQVVKETTWFRVSVFGKMAETCAQYLKKGSAVLVEGRLTPDKTSGGPRTYQRQDGTMSATYEVFANNVRFLSSRSEGGPGPAPAPSDDDVPAVGGGEDEIPF